MHLMEVKSDLAPTLANQVLSSHWSPTVPYVPGAVHADLVVWQQSPRPKHADVTVITWLKGVCVPRWLLPELGKLGFGLHSSASSVVFWPHKLMIAQKEHATATCKYSY